jgi:hypothetical protein
MVFVTQDEPDTQQDASLPDLFGPDWRLFTSVEQEFAANWKIALAVDRTRLATYTLSNLTGHEAGRAAIAQGRDFVTAGAAEDRDMACAAQRGLATKANDVFTFGLFEGAIRHFHRNLAAAIQLREASDAVASDAED